MAAQQLVSVITDLVSSYREQSEAVGDDATEMGGPVAVNVPAHALQAVQALLPPQRGQRSRAGVDAEASSSCISLWEALAEESVQVSVLVKCVRPLVGPARCTSRVLQYAHRARCRPGSRWGGLAGRGTGVRVPRAWLCCALKCPGPHGTSLFACRCHGTALQVPVRHDDGVRPRSLAACRGVLHLSAATAWLPGALGPLGPIASSKRRAGMSMAYRRRLGFECRGNPL